ncbi:MAG: hypothetical protein RLZZ116_2487 [Planctomycetota bacterium]|jgi:uncharacterized protein YacL
MTEERPERDGVAIDLPGEAAGGTPRGTRVILLFARLLFMALILATPALVIASRPINPTDPDPFRFSIVLGLTLAVGAIGLIVVVIDAMTPNKRLASIFGVYLGICLGLVGTFAIGTLLDTIIQAWELDRTNAVLYVNLAKVSVGLILCYIAVSVVMTTKDDFRLVIPYVEFSKQNRGVRPMLLDTSAIIDGRILDLSESGALDAPFVVLQPVIDELQKLSDSSDKGKRARGRRGLDMIAKLQASPRVAISIEEAQIDGGNVDRGLVDVAKLRGYRVVTTDAGLAKIAEIAAVTSININRIAGALRAQALAGDRLEIELVREGENPTQGVGYLADGTMVVVEGGAGRMGETVSTVVTNTLTTSAGRLIFARVEDLPPESGSAASMATRATTQPKHRDGPRESHRDGGQPRDEDGRPGSGRNPRRG